MFRVPVLAQQGLPLPRLAVGHALLLLQRRHQGRLALQQQVGRALVLLCDAGVGNLDIV